MKKKWEKPRIEVQEFIPNEYVAACYKIRCTTPNNNGYFYRIYDDTNKNNVLDKDDKRLYYNIMGFQGCNEWHKGVIQDDAPTANGFVKSGDRVYSVFWWKESLGADSDYHVMTPGKENYETNPNAS